MQNQSFQWKEMTLGVCYYPEHWSRTLWREDLERMKEAGITCIRVGEFAWSLFEPREGEFVFDFFDEFLGLCQEEGMQVIFGTPTATPPAWLTKKYPEALNALPDGTLLRHGGRRHYNYNSPIYQSLCARVVEELAKHYGSHPAIVGWQIDNELNCETDEFYAEADSVAFRVFLRERYGSLERLNEAWGTVFWNETYTDWEEIYCPRPLLNGGHNPHLLLDYHRFISHSAISFARLQERILRKYVRPGVFLTTNGLFGNLDNHRLQREVLDVYTYDSYPNFAFEVDKSPKTSKDLNDRKWSRNLTEVRSICRHFGIMEQQSGAGGWVNRMEMPSPRPGQLTLWAMQSVAHGADYLSFFRWRTCAFGTEMYWHGILDYDNRDNRKLEEVKRFGRLFKSLKGVCGSSFVASFALVKDYDNEWDACLDATHRRLSHKSELEIFAAAELTHTPMDMVFVGEETSLEDLTGYPLLVYPHPFLADEGRAELFRRYVEQGGTLILGCRSGLKDLFGRPHQKPQPGPFAALTGTDVRDFTYTSPAEEEDGLYPIWNDILTPLGETRVLRRYEGSYYQGEASLTENRVGKGRVLHLGSAFSREMTEELFRYTGVLSPFKSILEAPGEVELVMRENAQGERYLFALNFDQKPQTLVLKKRVRLCTLEEQVPLEGQALEKQERFQEGELTLPAFGTCVLQVK